MFLVSRALGFGLNLLSCRAVRRSHFRERKQSMDPQDKDRLFRKGLEAFNSGLFYEAHEHWEEVWLDTPDPEKMFLQGLIQVAAAFHHYSRANRQGTHNLLRAGLTKVERFPHVHGGLELEPLRVAVRRWLAALQAGEDPAKEEIPRIDRIGEA